MDRGVGEFEFVRRVLPEWTAVPIALLTQLGDVWFLSLLLAVLYWVHATDREALGIVSGLTLAGFALLDALKYAFAFPRPDRPLLPVEALPAAIRPLYEATALAAGHGFPSGHALAATIVYLGLAEVLSVSTRRRRFAVASALVVVVSLSRVALGVHYLVDVVAGVGVGLLFLLVAGGALARLPDRGTAAFGLAVLLGGLNLLASGGDADAVLLFGASLGAFGGWQLAVAGRQLPSKGGLSAALRSHPFRVTAAVVAVAPLVAVFGYDQRSPPIIRAGVVGLGVAVFLVLPAALAHCRGAREG